MTGWLRVARGSAPRAAIAAAAGLMAMICWSCAAAAPFPPGASLRFERLGIAEGLAQNSVNDILQDPIGYMWFATENGLHRYDGYRFSIYHHDPQDASTVSDNYITAIALRSDGRLLVGTGTAGVNLLDPATGRFTRLAVAGPQGLSHNRVWDVVEDLDGNVWVATDAGLDRIEPSGLVHRYRPQADEPDGLARGVVRRLLVDSAGALWIGSFGGLNYLPRGAGRIGRFDAGITQSTVFREANVAAIHEDGDGVLWVGVDAAVARISADRSDVRIIDRPAPGGGSNLVTAINDDGRGNLWIATNGDGAERWRAGAPAADRFDHEPADPGSIGDGYINAVYRDATDVLWFGTASSGVSKLNPATDVFAHYHRRLADRDSLPSNVVWSLFEDPDGSVWIATESGLSRLDAVTGRYTTLRVEPPAGATADTSNVVYYVHRDRAGRLWAGTGEGLYRVNETTGLPEPVYAFEDVTDAEYAPIIHLIREDEAGRLWLGSFNGLLRYDPDTGATRLWRRENGELHDNWVMDVAHAGDGSVWVAGEGGLLRLDGDSGQVLERIGVDPADPRSLTHASVQSVALDGRGWLWVGTASGLQALDTSTGLFHRYGRDDGLPSDYVYGVVVDAAGLIWISTNRGLARLDPAAGAVDAFDISDGLQSNEFNTGAVHRGPGGRLYFGGINGFNAFDPDEIAPTAFPPGVAVTSVQVLGRQWRLAGSAELEQGLVLAPAETVFTLRFAAFDYKAPDRNRFVFRLDGFDGDWRDAGDSNTVTYTNLDPGSYRFDLRGANSDGVWSEQQVSLPIVIQPPFWATWYAYLTYAILAAGVVILVLRMWTARLRREERLKEERRRRTVAERLQQFAEELSASLDEEVMGERLALASADLVGYERAYLYRARRRQYECVGRWPQAAAESEPLARAPEQERRAWRGVLAGRQPRLLSGGQLPEGADNALVVPWSAGRSGAGALALIQTGQPYTAQAMQLVTLLVNQARVAMENARLFAEVQQLAITDGLTGLYNRRHFFELGQREFLRSVRYDTQLSLVLLDADHFKQINDRHGHRTGDRVLRRLAGICDRATREFDIVARYGGEEFVVLLPETDARVAAGVAERIRGDVAASEDTDAGAPLTSLTVSAGVAQRSADTEDLMSLIGAADRALYQAKEQGRNRTVVDPDSGAGPAAGGS